MYQSKWKEESERITKISLISHYYRKFNVLYQQQQQKEKIGRKKNREEYQLSLRTFKHIRSIQNVIIHFVTI